MFSCENISGNEKHQIQCIEETGAGVEGKEMGGRKRLGFSCICFINIDTCIHTCTHICIYPCIYIFLNLK